MSVPAGRIIIVSQHNFPSLRDGNNTELKRRPPIKLYATDQARWPAGDSSQYRNADKSDDADTTIDGCRYSMSSELTSIDH